MNEGTVLQAILRLLRVHPKVAWAQRINTGAAKLKGFYVRFGFIGCSDIIGQLRDGRLLAFEVKLLGEKPSKDQQLFLDKVNRHNGLAACVHSIEEADEALKGWRAIDRPTMAEQTRVVHF